MNFGFILAVFQNSVGGQGPSGASSDAHGQGRHAPTGGRSKIKRPTLHYVYSGSRTIFQLSHAQVAKFFLLIN